MNCLLNIDPRIKERGTDLLDLPTIIRVSEFTDESAETFSKEISKAHRTGQPIIPILIDTYGGSVYSLLSMISNIQHAKLPVATICIGKAMSAGAALLTFGTEGHRYIDPNATVMIHDVSSWISGKNEEVKASSKQTDKLQKQVFGLMAENCNQRDKEYFLKILHEKSHADWYLTPAEAKKHNIVNHLRVPSFKIDVSVKVTLE